MSSSTDGNLVLTLVKGKSVANGSQVFQLESEGPVNVVETFTLTPPATAGTITVQVSPDGGETWDNMASGGQISAATSSSPDRVKPSGRGLATHVKFTFSGVTGSTSFKSIISQGA